FAITRQPGEIEIKILALRQTQQSIELRERAGACLRWRSHELGELEMHANDICAQRFHLAEIAIDARPVDLPIVFDQAAGRISVVVESPWHEALLRAGVNKSALIWRDGDTTHRRRRRRF